MREFQLALRPFVARFQLASTATAVFVASVAAAATTIVLALVAAPVWGVRGGAIAVFAIVGGITGVRSWRRWTPDTSAAAIEGRSRGLDNLIVTACEASDPSRRRVHPLVLGELVHAARGRLSSVSPSVVQPLGVPAAWAAAGLAATVTLLLAFPGREALPPARPAGVVPAVNRMPAAGDLRVVLVPPAYAARERSIVLNPREIAVLEGTRIRLEMADGVRAVQLVEPGQAPLRFEHSDTLWRHEFTADRSRILLIQSQAAGTDGGGSERLVHVRVEPDRRPVVRIRLPARDLIFPDARGQVAIEIEAQDDVRLASLSLTHTRMVGSGETFTFEEGDTPLDVQQAGATAWTARATLSLAALKLEEGDTLIYRAVATDGKPGGDPATSETFLIEIGRVAGAASTGFALPAERDRQGLSQQMLIAKTERLHADRGKLSGEALAEESRLLAIEQRMVKAEFVFMTGGEVEDEVVEAESGHELAEGRLENQGQVELLAAIREMSRAEARLNAGDTGQALVFERGALRALQRAFNRRRYLLRTLPERTRIDLSRRLTGDLTTARSTAAGPTPHEPDAVSAAAREVMTALASAVRGDTELGAGLAARVLAADPESEALRRAALAISSGDRAARMTAARDAGRLLAALVHSRAGASPAGRIGADPLGGRLADALARRGVRP